MSALEYVLEQQREFPPSAPFSELPDVLWEGLGDRIPLFIARMREEGRLAIGTISKDGPYLYLRYLANREYAVLVHEDLFQLIYRLARALLSRLNVTLAGVEYKAEVDSRRNAEVVADILWWFKKTGTIFGPQYQISQPQITFAGSLTVEAENFLLAHELGHLIIYPGYDPEPEDLIMRLLSGSYEGFIPADFDKWEEEFRADIVGFRLVMGISVGQVAENGWQNQLRYAGAELMLLIQQALEALGFCIAATHPTASKRLDIMRKYARSISATEEEYERLASIARMFDGFLADAINRILDPQLDRDLYVDDGDEMIRRVEQSLWEFTRNSSPEYSYFYLRMNEILEQGHYHVLIDRIIDYIVGLRPTDPEYALRLEFMQTVGTTLSEAQSRELRQFHMYKLLIGYFMRQANPIGIYVMQRAEETKS